MVKELEKKPQNHRDEGPRRGNRDRLMISILGWTGLGLALLQFLSFLWGMYQRNLHENRLQQLQLEKVRDEIAHLRRVQVSLPHSEGNWVGYRKFRVLRKRTECEGCQSIYLGPHDGRPLPSYRPGQYLTLSLAAPGEKNPIVRCYTLSESPRETEYRITVKKLVRNDPLKTAGKASSFLCDTLKAGDILDVMAPKGNFYLDIASTKPVVCIGAGIGVTPLIAMLETLLGTDPGRQAFLFLGMRNSREHPFKEYCQTLADRHPNLRLVVCYSQPLDRDQHGEDFHRAGRLVPRIVTAILPSSNYEFFLCGPGSFMTDMVTGLTEWGVEPELMHTETFGPSSFRQLLAGTAHAQASTTGADSPAIADRRVRFDRAGVELAWDARQTSLLDFAEASGIYIPSGCRTGSCGSCTTAIKSGKVRYEMPADFECEDGVCVPCVCIPDGDLVLDA
jgi:uncharacterized protein